MRKKIGLFAAAAFLLLATAVPSRADPPDTIILAKPKVFGTLTRAKVRFTHKDHLTIEGVSCLTCHHELKDGKNIQDPTQCAACHVTPADLQRSFHSLCITCHDTEKKKGRMTGPRTCGECHAWER